MEANKNIKFGKTEIEQRCFNYSSQIVKVIGTLPKTMLGYTLGKQLLRSGTSVGANVAEAHSAFTKAEFTYFMNVAKREAKESLFWLYLLVDNRILSESLSRGIIQETDELLRILSKIVFSSRKNSKENNKDKDLPL